MRSFAGQAFAEGGFGCVFRPQLSCSKPIELSKKNPTNGVSKLMKKKNQQNELKELNTVHSIVKKIKNYEDYFLVNNIYGCTPGALTKEDKVDFNIKCKNLVKKGIHKDNINKKLNSLGIINLPYGGISIDNYFSKLILLHNSVLKKKSFVATNKALLLLLTKGIVFLQKQKFLHMDIKGANILRSEDDILKHNNVKTRLIDWGISIDYASGVRAEKAPAELYNGPIQYNTPFSTILFQKDMSVYIKKFISQYSTRDKAIRAGGRHQLMRILLSTIVAT